MNKFEHVWGVSCDLLPTNGMMGSSRMGTPPVTKQNDRYE